MDTIVTINDNQYRYRYNSDTKQMDYLGPVGDSPPITEAEFQKYLLFHDSDVQGALIDPDVDDEELKENVIGDVKLWSGAIESRFYVHPIDRRIDMITRPAGHNKKGEWWLVEKSEDTYDDLYIGEFDTWDEVLAAVREEGEKQTRELERRGVFKE